MRKNNMLKLITVFLIMTMFVIGMMRGQNLTNSSKGSPMDLREAVSKESEKLKNESATVDVKKWRKFSDNLRKGRGTQKIH